MILRRKFLESFPKNAAAILLGSPSTPPCTSFLPSKERDRSQQMLPYLDRFGYCYCWLLLHLHLRRPQISLLSTTSTWCGWPRPSLPQQSHDPVAFVKAYNVFVLARVQIDALSYPPLAPTRRPQSLTAGPPACLCPPVVLPPPRWLPDTLLFCTKRSCRS